LLNDASGRLLELAAEEPRAMFVVLTKYLYAPLFFLGFIGIAIAIVEAGGPRWWLPGLLLVAIAVSFVAERIAPYEPAWNNDKRDSVTDIVHALVNEASLVLSVSLLPIIAAVTPHFDIWPHHWLLVLQLVLGILVADLGITIAHVFSHRYDVLWRIHAVHHAAPRMYGFNGLMKHPLHWALEMVAATAPLVLMGMNQDVAWLIAFAVGIQLLLQHSNVDMKIGPLAYVWAIANAHRHHHVASKTQGDVNFGLFTSIWDHMLGTFVIDRPQPKDGDLGVAGRPDFPRSYLAHLLEPFRPAR
jgi:sterol desaturase/sphingolipid hydroxylase (fatty acid hydroxylase superfamily)